MKTELEQFVDTMMAADLLRRLGDWKPGEPKMEKELGNIRFLGWCGKFERQIRAICNDCPFQIKTEDIWLNEEHTEGIPANLLCEKYKQIRSCYDAFEVAKTCEFIDKEKFGVYIKELQSYHDEN